MPSPNSRKAYHDDLKAFVEHMAAIGIQPFAVTGDHVRTYLVVRENDCKRQRKRLLEAAPAVIRWLETARFTDP